jgi:hypothetical protein
MGMGLVEKLGEVREKRKAQGMILRVATVASPDKMAKLAKTTSPDRTARLAEQTSIKDLKNKYVKIRQPLIEFYQGGNPEQLKEAVKRRCIEQGIEWSEEIWQQISTLNRSQ